MDIAGNGEGADRTAFFFGAIAGHHFPVVRFANLTKEIDRAFRAGIGAKQGSGIAVCTPVNFELVVGVVETVISPRTWSIPGKADGGCGYATPIGWKIERWGGGVAGIATDLPLATHLIIPATRTTPAGF